MHNTHVLSFWPRETNAVANVQGLMMLGVVDYEKARARKNDNK